MMHHAVARFYAVILMSLISAFVGGCDKHAEDKRAIQAVIDVHAKANEGKDGQTVLSILTDSTFEYNQRLLKLALDGSKAEIARLSAWDRLMVARIRAKTKRAQVEKMSGREFTAYMTSQGWFSWGENPSDVEGIELTDFKFAPPDTAYARPRTGESEIGFVGLRSYRREKKSPFKYTFIRQSDGWKYDETSSYEHWSSEIEEMAAMNRSDVDGLIVEMITEETEKKQTRAIFEKPMR